MYFERILQEKSLSWYRDDWLILFTKMQSNYITLEMSLTKKSVLIETKKIRNEMLHEILLTSTAKTSLRQ